MRRLSIMTLAVAMAAVIAVPAGAKKPAEPGKPNTEFKPVACQVDIPLVSAGTDAMGSCGDSRTFPSIWRTSTER